MNKEQKIMKFAKELEVLYEVFNWKWQDEETPPTADQIEEIIYELINDIENGQESVETGGLKVSATDFGIEIEWCLTKSIYVDEQD